MVALIVLGGLGVVYRGLIGEAMEKTENSSNPDEGSQSTTWRETRKREEGKGKRKEERGKYSNI